MIDFQQVTKIYDRPVVAGVSLRLSPGQVHVLLGQSGSGKSTLLRLAAGLIQPTKGRISLNERDASTLPDSEKAQLFGYMIQDGGLFPHLTCAENILLPGRVHRMAEAKLQSRLQELLTMVGLAAELMERYPRQVSGGQRQRVALARSLILDPPLIFLDEPLGALDPLVRSDLQEQLKQVFTSLKKTVLLVTHDLSEAAFFADTITLLKDGRVEQHGPAEDLFEKPGSQYVSEYFQAQRPPLQLARMADKRAPI